MKQHLGCSPSLSRARARLGPLATATWVLALGLLQAGCGGGGAAADGSTPGDLAPPASPPVEASLTGVEPEHPDASGDELLVLGEGLDAGVRFTLEDLATGRQLDLGAGQPAAGGGRRLRTPPLAGVGEWLPARLVARRSDGLAIAPARTVVFQRAWRAIDGTDDESSEPDANVPGSALARRLPAAYADGIAALAGPGRPNPRAISNAVCAQEGDEPNAAGASDMLCFSTTRLADVIRRNTAIGPELDDDAFRVGEQARPRPPARQVLPGALAVERMRTAQGMGSR